MGVGWLVRIIVSRSLACVVLAQRFANPAVSCCVEMGHSPPFCSLIICLLEERGELHKSSCSCISVHGEASLLPDVSCNASENVYGNVKQHCIVVSLLRCCATDPCAFKRALAPIARCI